MRYLIISLALFFSLLVLVVSVLPVNRVALGTRPRYAATAADKERAARTHVIVHVGFFGAIACAAWIVAAYLSAAREEVLINRAIALAATMLLGCGTEYLQHEVYRNALEFNDIFTNLLSIMAVFGILALIDRRRQLLPAP